ncbi:MAG TPA: NUDIX hydrolase [Anaerolineae bacterium]|nr:NUDIX hydrolase [Anaerolineae bacterium]
MSNWKTLAKRMILDHSRFLAVEEHTVALPTGEVIPDWSWVVTPDFVNVLPVTREGQCICLRQTKYGLNGLSLALAGGYIENDESPLSTAQRELREETGYEATDWLPLGTYRVDPNRGVALGHLFMARDALFVGQQVSDDLEEQEILFLSPTQLQQALHQGQFQTFPWALLVSLALPHLFPT